MKYTMNLDAGLLDRVVTMTGARTKTEAVTTALREVERRGRLIERLREGLGASEAELRDLFDPSSDPAVLRAAEERPTYHGPLK
jgi:hypothetical protein